MSAISRKNDTMTPRRRDETLLPAIHTRILLLLVAVCWSAGPLVGQGRPADRPVQVVTFVLTERGFAQSEITIPSGLTRFELDNRAFAAELSLNLERFNGASLATKQLRRKKRQWRQAINLTPGEYVVSVAGRPRWRGRLIVTTARGGPRGR